MTDTQAQMILRELDKLSATVDKGLSQVSRVLNTHDERLSKVEQFHCFLKGARDAMGWRIPLGIAVTAGITVGVIMEFVRSF